MVWDEKMWSRQKMVSIAVPKVGILMIRIIRMIGCKNNDPE